VADSLLLVSYYSSHEGKTSIYFARLWLSDMLRLSEQKATPDPFLESDQNGTVKLACLAPDATIHFTLDGTVPTPHSPQYTKPLHIAHNTLLQMIAVQPGKMPSAVVAFRVGANIPQPALKPTKPLESGLTFTCITGPVPSAGSLVRRTPSQSGLAKRVRIPSVCTTNQFGLIFRGFLQVPADGMYTFSLLSNDGSCLWLDGEKLIDNDGAHVEAEKSNISRLQAGMHRIEVRYFQAGGTSELRFFWQGPAFGKTEVPATAFFHEKEK
jgi:hypothetical protein